MSVLAKNISLSVDGEDWLYPFDLQLEPGSFTTLLGATRAGKTSLLRVLAGLAKPTNGKLFVDGDDVTGVNVRKRNVGMVYQEFVNYPGKTVFENIAAPLRNAGESDDFIKNRVGEVAEIVGISPLLNRFPLELSGGQQQRLSIARTIARPRSLVLLDEPLVNLDYKLREHLRGEFRRIFSDSKTIAVYASSEPREALILDGDVLVLNKGRLLQHGKASEVYKQPSMTAVARQVSDPPISVVKATVRTSGGQRFWQSGHKTIGKLAANQAELVDGEYQLGFYPHHLGIDHSGDGLATTIDFVEVSGSSSFLYASFNGQSLAINEKGIHNHSIGQELSVSIDMNRALVFKLSGELMLAPEKGGSHG